VSKFGLFKRLVLLSDLLKETNMSGGHFQYKQYEIGHIADEIEQIILNNDSEEVDSYGYTKGYAFSPETIEEFKYARLLLLRAQIYAQRVDWLVSCDDGEDSFHSRLEKDLDALYRSLNEPESPDVI
jgi:hypothetical protein